MFSPENDLLIRRVEGENTMENTADFKKNVSAENIDQFEKWMNRSFKNDPRYKGNEKWLEDRQRTLLRVYCDVGDREGAKRMLEQTCEYHSQVGRIKKFEKYFGVYDGARFVSESNLDKEGEPISDSSSFRQALLEKRFKEAEKWLDSPATVSKYADCSNVLDDRRRELGTARNN